MMAQKLAMDLPPDLALGLCMDAERNDLVITLCTEVGILMEDMSPLALMIAGVGDGLEDRLDQIDAAIAEMAALLAAARIIAGRGD